jgi:hypothetical protein
LSGALKSKTDFNAAGRTHDKNKNYVVSNSDYACPDGFRLFGVYLRMDVAGSKNRRFERKCRRIRGHEN